MAWMFLSAMYKFERGLTSKRQWLGFHAEKKCTIKSDAILPGFENPAIMPIKTQELHQRSENGRFQENNNAPGVLSNPRARLRLDVLHTTPRLGSIPGHFHQATSHK